MTFQCNICHRDTPDAHCRPDDLPDACDDCWCEAYDYPRAVLGWALFGWLWRLGWSIELAMVVEVDMLYLELDDGSTMTFCYPSWPDGFRRGQLVEVGP